MVSEEYFYFIQFISKLLCIVELYQFANSTENLKNDHIFVIQRHINLLLTQQGNKI